MFFWKRESSHSCSSDVCGRSNPALVASQWQRREVDCLRHRAQRVEGSSVRIRGPGAHLVAPQKSATAWPPWWKLRSSPERPARRAIKSGCRASQTGRHCAPRRSAMMNWVRDCQLHQVLGTELNGQDSMWLDWKIQIEAHFGVAGCLEPLPAAGVETNP